MKIKRIQSQIVRLPAEEPLAGGPGFYRQSFEFVILRMETEDGIEGIGVTFFGWALTAALKHAVDQLSELVIGEDPLRTEAVGRKIRSAAAGAGPGGIHALDLRGHHEQPPHQCHCEHHQHGQHHGRLRRHEPPVPAPLTSAHRAPASRCPAAPH